MSKKRTTPLTALRNIHDLLYLREEAYKFDVDRPRGGRWVAGQWKPSVGLVVYYDPDKAQYWNRDMINDIADILDRVIPRPTRPCRADTYPWRRSRKRK